MLNISVIIPVYNGQKFIARAIDSVLKQTLPAFEIIVINDGSKDGTQAILEQYKDKIIYKTIPNGGVSNARNIGIEMSHGDWVAFLDADDQWMPNKLETQLTVLSKFSDAGFCCGDFILQTPQREFSHFGSLSNYPADKGAYFLDKEPFASLVKQNFVGTSTAVINRKLIDKVGLFNINYAVSEDYDYWLRCSMNTKFVVVAQTLAIKQQHDANLSNNKIKIYLTGQRVLRNIYEDKISFIDMHNLGNLCRAKIASRYYRLGDLYFEANRIKRAYKLYFCGLIYGRMSGKNMIDFLSCVLKKSLRLITFGVLSKSALVKKGTA